MRVFFLSLLLAAAPAASLAQVGAPPEAGAAEGDAVASLERLEAARDIERAIYEYGRAFDEGDFDAYVALFAPNGTWVGGLGAFQGREAIRGMLEANMAPGPRTELTFFHLMSSPIVALADSGMTATSVTRWTFFTTGEDGAPRPAMAGRYFDAWVKVDGQWLIARREAPSDIPFDNLSGLASQ